MMQFHRSSRVALTFLLLSTVCASTSAADEEESTVPEEVDLGRPVEFKRDIYPIFAGSCLACHNRTKAESDFILESAQSAIKGGSAGEAIVPGEPDESYLYMVAARTEDPVMPPMPNDVQAKPLTPKQLGLLRQWILEGAKGDDGTGGDGIVWQTVPEGLKAVYSIDADPFGRFVAAGRANRVTIYDLAAPGAARSLTDPALESPGISHRDYAHAVAFNPAGDLVATSGYRVVKLWKRGNPVIDSPTELPSVDVNVSADGALLVKISETGAAQLFQAADDKLIADLNKDLTRERLIAKREVDRAMREARVNVVKAQVEENQKRLDEQNKALEAANEKHKNATAAIPEVEQKLAEAQVAVFGPSQALADARTVVVNAKIELAAGQTAVSEAEKQLAEDTDNEDLRKQVDELRKNVEALLNQLATHKQTVVEQKTQALSEAQVAVAESEKQLADAQTGVADAEKQLVAAPDNEELKKKVEDLKKGVEEQTNNVQRLKKHVDQLNAKVLTESEDDLAEAEKQLAAAPDNEELKKKVEEIKKGVDEQKKQLDELKKALAAAEKAVADAGDAAKSAARGIELAKQSVARAAERLQARNDLQTLSDAELQQSTASRDEATAVAAVEIKVLAAVFVPHEPVVATIEAAGTIRLWSTVAGTPVDIVSTGAAIDGALKSTASDGRLLSIETDAGVRTTVDLFPEWNLVRQLGPQEAAQSLFVDRVLSLAFSPDGSRLAAGGGEASRSGELIIWKTADWTLEREIKDAHSDTVYGLDFSADGRFLASGAADKFVKVFKVETGEHVRSYEGHTHHVMDVSWKGDRTSIISAGADNVLKVWNAETGEQRKTISSHKKQVTSVEYVGLQDNFISSSGDKRVSLHQAGDGKAIREFAGSGDYVYCSSITQDGKIVVAGGEDGVVRVWNGADAKEISTFAP
jgi:WD40 repeat protein